MKIFLVAINTFRKSVRKRAFLLLFFVSLAIIGTSHLFAFLSVEEETKIMKDISLAAVSLFGMLIALFVASTEVSTEIEEKTIRDLLAKPVARHHFLLGKFIGVLALVAFNVVFMSAVLFAVLFAKENRLEASLLVAVFFTFLELTVITAVATMFSCITSGIISAAFSGFVYIVGHLTGYLEILSRQAQTRFVGTLLEIFYRVLPNLEKFNVRNMAIHNIAVPGSVTLKTGLYCLEYVCLFMLVAILFFRRREL